MLYLLSLSVHAPMPAGLPTHRGHDTLRAEGYPLRMTQTSTHRCVHRTTGTVSHAVNSACYGEFIRLKKNLKKVHCTDRSRQDVAKLRAR